MVVNFHASHGLILIQPYVEYVHSLYVYEGVTRGVGRALLPIFKMNICIEGRGRGGRKGKDQITEFKLFS